MLHQTCPRRQLALDVCLQLLIGLLVTGYSFAQTPEQIQKMQAARAAAKAGKPPTGQDGKPPSAGDKKPDDKKGSDEQPEPKVIRRDAMENTDSDPDELKATVGEDGKVAFQFRNQPWMDLIEWLSDISDEPLDWKELPGDRVNLASPGRYTVEETRDLFNRHLLVRGYTLLELDGGITVMKTDGINPGMVRRVEESKLHDLPPHTFVRTLLDVGWLSAEKLAEELKPMISGNGRLTALTTTNRLEAMDAAINLRQVADLLQEERNVSSRDALAPEFRLTHIAAEEAKVMLEAFLGVEKKSSAPMTPQQMQMMQRMQQQNAGKATPQKKEPEVSIVANTRQNSVLIRGPRDKIAVASEFIRRIDVPSDSVMSLEDIKSRVQAFRLESLDAEKLIEIVNEMNVLQPTTRIRVDKDNSAVVVSGAAVDRFIVKSLIDQLDGTGRAFEVLQLRRLDATEVAESIAFLMGQEEDDDDSSSSRRYYYYGYGNEEEEKESDQFRVAANTRYNQVLLWASESEMEEVRELLVKLGELPPPGGSQQTFRVIEAASTPATYEYLQRLQQQWESMSGTTLNLPDRSEFKDPIPPMEDEEKSEGEENESDEDDSESDNKPKDDPDDDSDKSDDESKKSSEKDSKDEKEEDGLLIGRPTELTEVSQSNAVQLTGTSDDSAETLVVERDVDPKDQSIQSMEEFDRQFRNRIREQMEAEKQAEQGAPVSISLDSEGNLVISSQNTDALDKLENLMLQVRPPQREYVVFRLKYARASMIKIDLTEYFAEEEEDEDSNADRFYRWYWGDDGSSDTAKPSGLSGRNKLKFVYNIETNTLIVSGASPSQLRTIRELIELWDVAEPVDEKLTRYTKLVKVNYGRAEKIAETLKDAYRDLLSGNDKAFQKKQQAKDEQKGERGNNRRTEGGGLADSESGQQSSSSDYNFRGKLSFGIDEVGNTLLISAEGKSLLDLMEDMVKQLDEAARPGGEVEVMQIDGNVSGSSIEEALKAFGLESQPEPAARRGKPPRAEAPGQEN